MRKGRKHPLDALFAPGVTKLEQDCIIAEHTYRQLREFARRRARGERVEEVPKIELPDAGRRPARLSPPTPDDDPKYRENYHYLLAEHMLVPAIEGEPQPKSPREWREEHLRWMATPGVAELYDDKETPDQLEATTYWDYCHGRFVPMCPACLTFRAREDFRLTQQNRCRHCQHESDGREWVRASYLLLLGEPHPHFPVDPRGPEPLANVFRFLTIVYGAAAAAKDFTRVNVETGEEASAEGARPTFGPESMLADYDYCCSEEKVSQRKANAKALALFRRLFGKRKYDRFVNYGEVWVDGADGLKYRIFYSHHGNVAVYDDRTRRRGVKWRPVSAYCGHFGENYPVVDQVIAQALMFRTDPGRYISQANEVAPEHMPLVGPQTNYHEEMKEALAYA